MVVYFLIASRLRDISVAICITLCYHTVCFYKHLFNIGELHMANSKSAIKRIETAERNKKRNDSQESKLKTNINKAITAIATKNEKSAEILKQTIKVVDTVATKGIIHKNKANRIKSRLTKKLNKAAV